MGSNVQDEYDYLFDDEDPHAIIEAQRRQQEDSESDEVEVSESEDELGKAFPAAGGFEDDGNKEEEVDDEEFEAQYQNVHSQPTALVAPLSRTFPSTTAPTPHELTVNIPRASVRDGENDSDQEFEDVPLRTAAIAAPAVAPPATPAKPGRGRRSNKEPRTVNLNGLPICLDEHGVEIGYKETPPKENTYAWTSDTPIAVDDPYFAKGCERRMTFESDPIPVDQQFKAHEQSFVKKIGGFEFLSAVDKAYDWNRTRRGVTGATDETLKDGKIPRHFVLKMGPPNGPNGDAVRVAERLKALVEHFFYSRLATSHLTIEIEIPYHGLGGQSYYEKYMEKIQGVMENKKIRDRLTVQLAPQSAQQYLNCEPKWFYPPDADHGAIWLNKVQDLELIWALLYKWKMPKGWIASLEEIATAKQRWLHNQKLTEADKKYHIDQAIEKIQGFVRFVCYYEAWKRDGSKPPAPPASAGATSSAPKQSPNAVPSFPVVADQQNALGALHSTASQRAATAPSASFPPHATAPFFFPAPQAASPSTHSFGQAPFPPLRPLESFRQPDSILLPRYRAREDQYSSIMSFGSTSEQQARNINEMMQHQIRQYHRGEQQAQMQAYQQRRQQQRGPPVAPVPATAASPAPLSSSESSARSGATGAGSSTTSSLAKRKGDEKENEHAEKRSRQ